MAIDEIGSDVSDDADGDGDESGRMTLMGHIAELRSRLLKVIIAVMLGGLLAWVFYPSILDALLAPYCDSVADRASSLSELTGSDSCSLLVTDPLEGFTTRLKIAAYGGIALAMPIILWQLWRFIAPGLYSHERKWAVPFVVAGLTLFVMGASLAYWTMPRALGFLSAVGGPDLVEFYSPAPYLSLITYMMLAFGLGFQFPILLIFLQLAGILEPATLRSWRRYAIVGIVVLVAVVTPSGDPISLLALSIPMILFYEVAIWFGWYYQRRKLKLKHKQKK